jgi:hypothetical protein
MTKHKNAAMILQVAQLVADGETEFERLEMHVNGLKTIPCGPLGAIECAMLSREIRLKHKREISHEAMKPKALMKPHQQRVIDEKAELEERAKALSYFIGYGDIFPTLDASEQERLKEQNEVMWEYCEILGARIAAFSQ